MSTPKIINKIDAGDPETLTANIVQDNVEQLKSLFPEAVTEGKIDFEVLKQLLGGIVDDREEKYGLNWHGKRKARQLALTPSTGTLRPCPEDSVNWDTTQNLMIEGDNLEVLKLLQKSYAGKVKLIYIDPPYNTGKDFVYPDNFQDNIKNYLELTGQTGEGGKKLSSNTEASGRFHTDWLNMMYSRLKLAKDLLAVGGMIFISIDEREMINLSSICEDLFSDNNVESMVWKKVGDGDAGAGRMKSVSRFRTDHEYVVCAYKTDGVQFKKKMEVPNFQNEYGNPDNDLRGPYKAGNMSKTEEKSLKTGKNYFKVVSPSGKVFERQWHFDLDKFAELNRDGRIYWGKEGSAVPSIKIFINEPRELVNSSLLEALGSATSGSKALRELFDGAIVFENPKPLELIRRLIEMSTGTHDLILDFFAGSGTTGHAVSAQNALDGGTRQYILVQLPEPLDENDIEQKAAADFCNKLSKPRNIAELTKERLRRAGKKIKEENPLFAGDLGFRVFKLASSNIQAWEPNRDKLAETLEASIEHLKTDRTEQDILFELLLKLGLDLCVPIEKRKFAGKEVHAIGGGVLFACLAEKISRTDVEALAQGIVAWNKEFLLAVGYTAEASKSTDAKKNKTDDKPETTCVFRDSGFVDDVAKTNLAAILQQHGLLNVRSL